MSLFGCDNRYNCTLIAVIASVIIGIVTAFLRITAVITLTPAFLWVVFGIAAFYLAVLLAASPFIRQTDACEVLSTALSALVVGILGTILFSVILLAISFVATSVVGAIIAGALLFSFSLTVISTTCVVKCIVNA